MGRPRAVEVGRHLPAGERARLGRVFAKFVRLGFVDHVLVGGLALEATLEDGERRATLNDVDLAVPGFAALPARLGDGFLVHHVHRHRPPGKMLVQLVCPDDAVRIDVFGARGGLFAQAGTGRLGPLALRVAAPEDMASRIASELMSLVHGGTAPAKAARDHRRLAAAVRPPEVEAAWRDQRRAADPDTYAEACRLVAATLAFGGAGLSEPTPLRVRSACPLCGDAAPFRLADPDRVRALLGHD